MEAHIHELTASVAAIPTQGDLGVTATISLRTPDPAIAALALAVLGVVGTCAVVMLASGFPHQQSAEPALGEDHGGRLDAAD